MSDKIRNIIVTCVFVLFIFFFAAMCVVSYFNPVAESTSERRPLAQFPDEITWQGIVDKTVIERERVLPQVREREQRKEPERHHLLLQQQRHIQLR